MALLRELRRAVKRFDALVHLRSAAGVRHWIRSSPSTETSSKQLGAADGLALGSRFVGAAGARSAGGPLR